ncbi:hypothetical protein ACEYYA_15535 [Paracoccus sp. p3-h83]|uniref:hypothetical protein n=1 Tax=Paracoccus sp. p3-h83 TaxID=3342805 RepID=UPI0035BAF35D
MSKSLAERLQERLEGQTAEIAALTDSELKKLSAHVQSSLDEELSDIRIVIDRYLGGIANDLPVLKWTLFGTWVALIVSLMLTGFLLWRSTQAPPPPVAPEPFETFQSEGQNYLLIPDAAKAMKCQDSSGAERLCLRLPVEN